MKKTVLFILLTLSMVVYSQGIDSDTFVLYDVEFERKIDMLNLEGESYDSVLVKFNVGSVFEETVKVNIWDKHGVQIYSHAFRKMDCIRSTKDFDDNVIIVGKTSIFFLVIKKCDDGPKLCVIREREGITKSPNEYLWEYFKKLKRSPEASLEETRKVYDVVEIMPQFPARKAYRSTA